MPFLRQLATTWACESASLLTLRDLAGSLAASPIERAQRAIDGERVLQAEISGPTASIAIDGILMERVPWWMHYYGLAVTDLSELRSVLDELAADPGRVREVVLRVNSPGGTVAGTLEAAAAIGRVRAAGLSVRAECAGMACSGAYWLASQAETVSASPTTLIGSIGVYTLLIDDSAAQEAQGERWILVSSGGVKGLGADGRISDELLSETQGRINDLATLFRRAVGAGRQMTDAQVSALATGQVWLAEQAQERGLIDAITDPLAAYAPAEDEDAATDPAEDEAAATATTTTLAQEPTTMTPAEMAALIKAHPAHATLVADAFTAGHDRAAALEAIATAERERADTAEAAAAQASQAQAQAFVAAGTATPDPGADDSAEQRAANPTGNEALQAAWNALPADKQAEFMGDFSAYCWLARNQSRIRAAKR